jgi:XapX domain-containing protein
MKTYAAALAAGVLVGVIYSLLNVRSPAPPVVALLGLLGMLAGEQIIPISRQFLVSGRDLSAISRDTAHHMFGALPGRGLGAAARPRPTVQPGTPLHQVPPGRTETI